MWALLSGAVVLAVGMRAMHLFTILYVTRAVESKSETYGALGAAIAVLVWCYGAGRLVTGTAVVNAALWRRYRQPRPVSDPRGEVPITGSRVGLVGRRLRSVGILFR